MRKLSISDQYGSVKVTNSVPKGYAHVPGQRLGPLCEKLGIKWAKALTGWKRSRFGAKPVYDGVVVIARSQAKLLAAVAERSERAQSPRAVAARARAAERRVSREFEEEMDLLRKGIEPGSRTAAWYKAGKIDADAAELITFKTWYRHNETNYDECLRMGRDSGEREYARSLARATLEERPIPSDWAEYLSRYDFDSAIALRLSQALQNPRKAHPVWFKEAEIAVRRAALPLDTITYEQIRDAISAWKSERCED